MCKQISRASHVRVVVLQPGRDMAKTPIAAPAVEFHFSGNLSLLGGGEWAIRV